MRDTAARNDWIRNNNTRLIRNLIREQGEISKAELAKMSGLTFPTVTQAVNDLLHLNEVVEKPGKSCGGRPANNYSINPGFCHFFCSVIDQGFYEVSIYDYEGTFVHKRSIEIDKDFSVADMIGFLKILCTDYPLMKYGIIGVPGVTVHGEIKHFTHCKHLENVNVQKELLTSLGLKVVIENDINAIAMGEANRWEEFAHIIWTNCNCIGSAIVLNHRIRSGAHGCAGEVEYACRDLTDRYMSLQDAMMAIYSVVDVPVIAFSGETITKEDMEKLQAYVNENLLEFRRPQLEYVANEKELYMKGLLTIMEQYFREL